MTKLYVRSVIKATVQAKWTIIEKSEQEKLINEGVGTIGLLDAATETPEAIIFSGTAIEVDGVGVNYPDGKAKADAVDNYNSLVRKRMAEYEAQGYNVIGTLIGPECERWDDPPIHEKFSA